MAGPGDVFTALSQGQRAPLAPCRALSRCGPPGAGSPSGNMSVRGGGGGGLPVSRCLPPPGLLGFPWRGCGRGRGGSPGCGLPGAGGDRRVWSPALQASGTGFPTAPGVFRPARPVGRSRARCLLPPGPCSCLPSPPHGKLPPSDQTQEPALPGSCLGPLAGPGLALRPPSGGLPACPPRSPSTTAPRGRVSAPARAQAEPVLAGEEQSQRRHPRWLHSSPAAPGAPCVISVSHRGDSVGKVWLSPLSR